MIHFRIKAEHENKNESTIRHKDQYATNAIFKNGILFEIQEVKVIKETLIIVYYYTNSIDINRSPMRRYFKFMDNLANLPGTTIGHAEQSGSNGISEYLLPVEKSRSKVIREAIMLVLVYNSRDINRCPLRRYFISTNRDENIPDRPIRQED